MIDTSSFDRNRADFDRRFRRTQKLIAVWFVFVLLLVLSGFGLVVYTLINPEVIGQFAGDVVSGFESSR